MAKRGSMVVQKEIQRLSAKRE